ncbi:3'(2'),5'-bisphosphate nucleotidase CysQ [Schleiferiaceae bacterium]|nr:3'(2'),5'-bisphosphate nucleotidase CysQ [Schleiferiaceae bacterium]
MVYSDNLKIAINAAINAGIQIMKIYESDDFGVEIKGDDSPLTKADKASHGVIVSALSTTGVPVLSEEGAQIQYAERANWNVFWMIDPIDGTKEFIKKNGEFTVNIALIQNGKPILGVVYAPVLQEIFFAEDGLGSYKKIQVQTLEDFENAIITDLTRVQPPITYTLVVSKSHMNESTQEYVDKKEREHGTIDAASFGSSLKICKVADGSAHCYPRFGPTMEWDTAAAHAVAAIAGCSVTQEDEQSALRYNKENLLNPYFIIQR